MGGDDAPAVVAEGAVRALQSTDDGGTTDDGGESGDGEEALEVLLFGPEERVQAALDEVLAEGGAELRGAELPIRVAHAPDVIGMGEAPATAVKQKQQSSIHRGIGACKEGEADAFASAGNTGAIMAASLFTMGCLPEVDRPSVMGVVPTLEGRCLLMDVGTNVDCRPAHLVQFARMGTVYVRRVWDRPEPTVGLLNVGEEPGKGNEQARAAYDLLAGQPDLDFTGNVEGRDMLAHAADVVVCDGFIGNITLKFGESIATTLLSEMVRREIERQGLSRQEAAAVKGVLEGVQEPFDYEARGGFPLLGVQGSVLVGHGSSSARAIERMIGAAAEVAGLHVPQAIAAAFEEVPVAGAS